MEMIWIGPIQQEISRYIYTHTHLSCIDTVCMEEKLIQFSDCSKLHSPSLKAICLSESDQCVHEKNFGECSKFPKYTHTYTSFAQDEIPASSSCFNQKQLTSYISVCVGFCF